MERFSIEEVGFVAIGRNEGERLEASLKAITQLCPQSPVVYVDSGSTDNSVNFAKSLGIDVEELDMSIPFTAARARNQGFQRLLQAHPNLKLVQFFDGDCQMAEGWIESALDAFAEHSDVAIVSGRRSEKFPEASIYNTLMDIEWNTPVGEIAAVLGDMCVRVEAFKSVDGFDSSIIAAEDDDFCIRIRAKGHRILRIDASMSYHDANITQLSQWYRRSKRGGHGYANINQLHGSGDDRYFAKELRSVVFWGALVPALFLISLLVYQPLAFLLALAYVLFIAKTAARRFTQGFGIKISCVYAFLIYTGKVPEFFGIVEYWKNRLLSRKHVLIEYK